MTVLVAMAVPAIGFAVANFWGKGALREEVDHLQKRLDVAERDRDSKAAQLAPFLAIANQRFESAPPDKRLDLLAERVEELTHTVKETAALLPPQWKLLTDEAIGRLQAKLDYLHLGKIRISSVSGDKKAFELAQQLYALFQNSGFSVSGINAVISNAPIAGLRVTLRAPADKDLSAALDELFAELQQAPAITVNHSLDDADMELLVGSRD